MTDKLDTLEKILVATNAIQFMANRVHSCNTILKLAPPLGKPEHLEFYNKCRKETDEFLVEISERLTQLTEDLGNYCDGRDLMCESYDSNILGAAFDALYDREIEED